MEFVFNNRIESAILCLCGDEVSYFELEPCVEMKAARISIVFYS